ncbi:glutamate--tRNA ligase [Candidatus Bipolaricaulota sp. J31]
MRSVCRNLYGQMSTGTGGKLRVRFAPSPTGYLHVGGARTALFNWLWARREGGAFVLRIEDTDVARSERRFAEGILGALRWLGLDWDELHYQSERIEIYHRYAQRLLDEGKAYYCFCTPEEVAARLGKARGLEYDGHCRDLSPKEIRGHLERGRKPALRFIVPEEKKHTSFRDFLRGEMTFERLTTGDFVIMKSDGTPAYNFACVIDDHEMGITHVLRAEDHIPNTPKQIWLYEALGWDPPEFGHLSMILGPDRKKLSKRHGATSVEELKEKGFLPQAVVNYLALLGWSHPEGKEVLSPEELVEAFSLERVVLSPQVFDIERLKWFNRKHLARLSPDELLRVAEPFLAWLGEEALRERERLRMALALVVPSISTLAELEGHPDLEVLFRRPALPEGALEELSRGRAVEALERLASRLPERLSRDDLRPLVREVATELGVRPRDVFHPLRLALTGRDRGPELAAICEVLGAEEVRARISQALATAKSGR